MDWPAAITEVSGYPACISVPCWLTSGKYAFIA